MDTAAAAVVKKFFSYFFFFFSWFYYRNIVYGCVGCPYRLANGEETGGSFACSDARRWNFSCIHIFFFFFILFFFIIWVVLFLFSNGLRELSVAFGVSSFVWLPHHLSLSLWNLQQKIHRQVFFLTFHFINFVWSVKHGQLTTSSHVVSDRWHTKHIDTKSH